MWLNVARFHIHARVLDSLVYILIADYFRFSWECKHQVNILWLITVFFVSLCQQGQMSGVKLKMDVVVKENERYNKNPLHINSKVSIIKCSRIQNDLAFLRTKEISCQMGGCPLINLCSLISDQKWCGQWKTSSASEFFVMHTVYRQIIIWHPWPWLGCTKSSERLSKSFFILCLKRQELKAKAQWKMWSPETSMSRWSCLSRFGCTHVWVWTALYLTWTCSKKDVLHKACSHIQERLQAMELWQTAAQELEHLQQTHQRSIADVKIIEAQKQKLKVQQCHLEHQSLHCACPVWASH